jgi:fructose-1,6-bisphosphatase I
MGAKSTLNQFLLSWMGDDRSRRDLCSTITSIAEVGINLSKLISQHGLVRYGNTKKPLNIVVHNVLEEALYDAPVAYLASAEKSEPVPLNPKGTLAVAINPLDSSTNIESNMSIGTIFAVLRLDLDRVFEGKVGERLVAAGFLLYGPQTLLVLTCGNGTNTFTLEQVGSEFLLVSENIRIPTAQSELAINTLNYRFWDNSIKYFIDDCISGKEGPLGVNHRMRWNASLVAEAYRILVWGGIFLYPSDSRPGFEKGRFRLLFDALPLAFIVEQAGGTASDGNQIILDIELTSLHERIPLIFGSQDKVVEVMDYISGDFTEDTRFPLFQNRGLLRR